MRNAVFQIFKNYYLLNSFECGMLVVGCQRNLKHHFNSSTDLPLECKLPTSFSFLNLLLSVQMFFAFLDMSQLLLLGKFEYGGGPIFKVVLEC